MIDQNIVKQAIEKTEPPQVVTSVLLDNAWQSKVAEIGEQLAFADVYIEILRFETLLLLTNVLTLEEFYVSLVKEGFDEEEAEQSMTLIAENIFKPVHEALEASKK
jgi:hypothetical protein